MSRTLLAIRDYGSYDVADDVSLREGDFWWLHWGDNEDHDGENQGDTVKDRDGICCDSLEISKKIWEDKTSR